jgi:hypothetical protein
LAVFGEVVGPDERFGIVVGFEFGDAAVPGAAEFTVSSGRCSSWLP